MTLTIELEPVPKARPRVNTQNRGRFLPKRSKKFHEDFTLMLRAAFHEQPFTEPLCVDIHFFKPVKPTAKKYGDIDNLEKAVLDACNGILWLDDSQIVELHSYKHKGAGKIILEVD